MKILVTGAKGMLGQDLCPSLEDMGYSVFEADIDSFDITKENEVKKAVTEIKPDIVVHCAAYTNVDKAEEEQEKAFLINETGTKNIAKCVQNLDATMIYISTDYVFDGEKKSKYLPTDKTNPLNVYGKSKLAGEEQVKANCDKYYIARTSWLYGHHGKNFVETMISLSDKPELKVVNDQTGCPTWTMELVNGIIELIEKQKPYGVYHICGSGSTTWYEFAKEIFKQANIDTNLKPCKTEEFPRPAYRPKYSAMENDKACRNWKLALKNYIELRL